MVRLHAASLQFSFRIQHLRMIGYILQWSGTQTNSGYTLRPFSAILYLTPNPGHWHWPLIQAGSLMNPAAKIESVRIRGFRSLADVEFVDLPNATVLIGANGSGKSNFLRFLEMTQQMLRYRRLGDFVARHGGADDQLFGGSGQTPRIGAELRVKTARGRYSYRFELSYAHQDRFDISEGKFRFSRGSNLSRSTVSRVTHNMRRRPGLTRNLGSHKPHRESLMRSRYPSASAMVDLLGGCVFYQFHNTDDHSEFKKRADITDNSRLRPNGGNLATVLYRLEQEDGRRYEYICRQIQRVLPTFDRFDLEESYGKVLLRWKPIGIDKTIGPHLTSDGTLRFFALATLLNLPEEMLPTIIVLDEPELGLHPAAIHLLGGMIRSLSVERQVILATQSPLLVSSFDLNQIYALDLKDGQTQVRKLSSEGYEHWLEEYNTGDLWEMNLLGGRP